MLYGAVLSALWSFREAGIVLDDKNKHPIHKPVNQRKERKKNRRRKK